MNLGTYDINIDFSKLFIHNNTSIYFKEGDLNTAKVRARLTMKNKPINIAGCNVTIRIEPTEGNTITDNATVIDPINGIIEIDFKSNALLEGTHLFEVWIIKDESIKKSGKIGYRVLDSIEDAGSIEGTNEYPILISLISDTNKAIQDAKEVLNIAKDMEANVNEAIGNTNVAISNAETATSNANSKISELDDAKTVMVEKVDSSIATMKADVNKAKEDMKSTTDAKVKEIDTAITNMNSSVEDAKASMQATTDAKMQQVDNSIVAMKSDVETAKNEMASKADEKIADVDRALAAGTVDLELKASRDGEESLPARLKRDLYIDEVPVKQRVLNLENMKEMQDLEYSTDKGYAVCEKTGNGTVKDLKIYGRSFVNIGGSNFAWGRNYANLVIRKELIKPNVKYGFKLEGDLSNLASIYCGSSDDTEVFIPRTYNKTQLIFTSPNIIFTKEIKFICYNNGTEFTESQVKTWKLTIVECENEEKIPSYFEGLASVGNGSSLEVVTRKEDGNIFNIKNIKQSPTIKVEDNTVIVSNQYYNSAGITMKDLNMIPGQHYSAYCNISSNISNLPNGAGSIAFVRHGRDIMYLISSLIPSKNFITPNDPENWILAFYGVATGIVNFNDFTITKQTVTTSSMPYMEDKKTSLYKDSDGNWKPILNARGIDLNNCDIIDTTINKFQKKYDEGMINGSENWTMGGTQSATHRLFYLSGWKNVKSRGLALSKLFRFESTTGVRDYEYFSTAGGDINVFIRKDRLESEDAIGFKKWLTLNNDTIVFEMNNIETYEINPIYPEAFEDETLMLFKTGPISPRATWKITSNLVGVLGNVKDRVKRMENDFYKYTVTQNRMQLGTTYSSDRTTFRVDTATFSTEKAKQELDYDLFRLLRHNILVGPQNYDKAEMENMMDFYVSVGKIDYNMWDELYMLIEEQHNPPVEEEAPVI